MNSVAEAVSRSPGSAIIPALELKGVTKSFADGSGASIHALGPVDLRIEPGSFFAIVGPSGLG